MSTVKFVIQIEHILNGFELNECVNVSVPGALFFPLFSHVYLGQPCTQCFARMS